MVTAKDKASHRRQSRVIAPAVVSASENEIVVVVPDVLGKNEAHRRAGKHMHTSTAVKRYRESVRAGASQWRIGKLLRLSDIEVRDGAWRLDVLGVWPTQRGEIDGRSIDFVCPVGDADAAIPQALDTLQHAGILDDDARVVAVRAWNMYRKDVRATVIRLVRVEPDVREREAASLVRLAEQVPPQVKPKREKKTKAEVKP